MKKADMVCTTCNRFDGKLCHANPPSVHIWHDTPHNPNTHWCAQGLWHEWNERMREMIPRFWGEWEWDETGRKPKK